MSASAAGLLTAACGGVGDARDVSAATAAHATAAHATNAARATNVAAASDAGGQGGTGATTTPSPPDSASASPAASPSGPAPTPVASLGPGEGTLKIMALDGYAEWGGTDPKVKWTTPFEQRTGCHLSISFYDPATEDNPGAFAPSSFDVISATPELGGRLVADRAVAPLNTSLLDNYDGLSGRLRGLPSVKQGGQVYGAPFLWGTNQVLYDSRTTRPGGPEALFDDRGPVLFRDTPLSLADAALVLASRGGHVKDPFDLTPAQLDAAAGLFAKEAARPGARLFWRNPAEVVQAFATGRARLAQGTPYQLDVLRRGGTAVRGLPDRPVTGWADSWMVSAQTAHTSCAYKWLDWTASAEVQRKAAAWNGLAPANPAACLSKARAIRRVCADYRVGGAGAFSKVFFAVRPPDYAQWVDRWSRIAP
ncbi:extracellular solute-binding protein [Microbispora sp. RL4-1S]|uniref:Extracellular solute-binding protein n=1 Tax=Microbispora oryzae TaxID=2806554 RepID=A0A940WCE1_9ACTN|nr:extracellular solute-binding protein [Microbispora oryzae]